MNEFRLINAGDAPLNVAPAVDDLISAIMDVRRQQPNKTVVIAIGEHHAMPTHVVTQQILLSALLQSGLKPAYAVEWPHNLVGDILQKKNEGSVPTDVRQYISGVASASERFARAHLSTISHPSAEVSHRNAIAFAYKNKIPTWPIDPAWANGGALDRDDPITRRALAILYPDMIESGRPETGPETWHVSNYLAANLVAAHLRSTDVDVVVLAKGNTHILGLKPGVRAGTALPFDHSLTGILTTGSQFGERGPAVLPTFLSSSRYNWDTVGALPANVQKTVRIVSGLDDAMFSDQPASTAESRFLARIEEANSPNFERIRGVPAKFDYLAHIGVVEKKSATALNLKASDETEIDKVAADNRAKSRVLAREEKPNAPKLGNATATPNPRITL